MKRFALIFSLSTILFSCGNQDSGTTAENDDSKKTASVMDNPDYDKGLNLIAKSDCLTCHKLREAATGPAYGDIATKYENNEANLNMLAGKIIKGGQGNWGQIPMSAHPNLTEDDAKSMVKYIFLLKEEKK